MSVKIDLSKGNNKELVDRIIARLMEQGEPEIIHVLGQLFPNAPVLRIKSMATDFAEKRFSAETIFTENFENDFVDMDIFNLLSSANIDPNLLRARSTYDPTKFEITLTCARTPFKELFDECRSITCEECIETRIVKDFVTNNPQSKFPWSLKIDRVEQRRLDICKNCGNLLGKKDDINLQNERLLYTCSYCGHKGWTKAK